MEKYYLDEINNIESILDRNVLFIDGKKAISDIFAEIKEENCSEAVIVRSNRDHDNILVDDIIGLVNLDILKKSQVYCTTSNEKIEQIALKDFCTINSHESIRNAKLLMKAKSRDKLVVIEGRRVIGIITILDILKEQKFDEEEIEMQVRVVLDNIEEAICVVNKDGIVTFWNKSAEELYGYKKEDIKGKEVSKFFPNTSLTKCLKEERQCLSFKDRLNSNSDIIIDGKPIIYKGELIGAVSKGSDTLKIASLSEELKEKRIRMEELRREMNEIIDERYNFNSIPAKSKSLVNAIKIATGISTTDIPVLINGEVGTSKDLFARAIHRESKRKGRFISVNCGILPVSLLESKLFGYYESKGEGKDEFRPGAFQLASKGSLFLEEIGDAPDSIQEKLSKILKEGLIEVPGMEKSIKVDTRIIASTSKNLGDMLKLDKFREELYFELNSVLIFIPPLRDRKEDIPSLIEIFMSEFAMRNNRGKMEITPEAVETLVDYPWQGNEIQLKNTIERLVLLSQENTIHAEDIAYNLDNTVGSSSIIDLKNIYDLNLKDAVESFEKEIIMNALIATGGNKSKAAEKLKIKRSTLHYKLNLYGLTDYSPDNQKQLN